MKNFSSQKASRLKNEMQDIAFTLEAMESINNPTALHIVQEEDEGGSSFELKGKKSRLKLLRKIHRQLIKALRNELMFVEKEIAAL